MELPSPIPNDAKGIGTALIAPGSSWAEIYVALGSSGIVVWHVALWDSATNDTRTPENKTALAGFMWSPPMGRAIKRALATFISV